MKRSSSLPYFDERFINYGFNKVQWIENMRYLGYEFYVLAQAIHHLSRRRKRCPLLWQIIMSQRRWPKYRAATGLHAAHKLLLRLRILLYCSTHHKHHQMQLLDTRTQTETLWGGEDLLRQRKGRNDRDKMRVVQIGWRKVQKGLVRVFYSPDNHQSLLAGHISMSNTTKWLVRVFRMAIFRSRFIG